MAEPASIATKRQILSCYILIASGVGEAPLRMTADGVERVVFRLDGVYRFKREMGQIQITNQDIEGFLIFEAGTHATLAGCVIRGGCTIHSAIPPRQPPVGSSQIDVPTVLETEVSVDVV